jgi:hypothetical protein
MDDKKQIMDDKKPQDDKKQTAPPEPEPEQGWTCTLCGKAIEGGAQCLYHGRAGKPQQAKPQDG